MFTNCFILLGPQCDKIWHQNPIHVASLSCTHTVIKSELKIVYVRLYSLGPHYVTISGLEVLYMLLHPLATILSGLLTASSPCAYYFTLCFQNKVSCYANTLSWLKYGFQVALNRVGYFSSLATSTLIVYFEKC